jgi:hypothetical protein
VRFSAELGRTYPLWAVTKLSLRRSRNSRTSSPPLANGVETPTSSGAEKGYKKKNHSLTALSLSLMPASPIAIERPQDNWAPVDDRNMGPSDTGPSNESPMDDRRSGQDPGNADYPRGSSVGVVSSPAKHDASYREKQVKVISFCTFCTAKRRLSFAWSSGNRQRLLVCFPMPLFLLLVLGCSFNFNRLSNLVFTFVYSRTKSMLVVCQSILDKKTCRAALVKLVAS